MAGDHDEVSGDLAGEADDLRGCPAGLDVGLPLHGWCLLQQVPQPLQRLRTQILTDATARRRDWRIEVGVNHLIDDMEQMESSAVKRDELRGVGESQFSVFREVDGHQDALDLTRRAPVFRSGHSENRAGGQAHHLFGNASQ